MMKLHELVAVNKKQRKRIGRGIGSGHGKTSTKGHKGQKARSGANIPVFFEGGQMPLIRKVPKRGFTNIFKKFYAVVNLCQLEKLELPDVVDGEFLASKGLISTGAPFKILAKGEFSKSATFKVKNISKGAVEKIEKAGGKVEIISG